jgi:hypothetical protein
VSLCLLDMMMYALQVEHALMSTPGIILCIKYTSGLHASKSGPKVRGKSKSKYHVKPWYTYFKHTSLNYDNW